MQCLPLNKLAVLIIFCVHLIISIYVIRTQKLNECVNILRHMTLKGRARLDVNGSARQVTQHHFTQSKCCNITDIYEENQLSMSNCLRFHE